MELKIFVMEINNLLKKYKYYAHIFSAIILFDFFNFTSSSCSWSRIRHSS